MESPLEEIVFYTYKLSPYGQRVEIALREKSIPFKAIYVDLKNKPRELLVANPIWGKVPTIIHGENPVSESLIILEYLEEAFLHTVSLMPKDAVGRSQVRFWADYINKGIGTMANLLKSKTDSPERQASFRTAPKIFKAIDEAMTSFSKDGPFFTGEKFGYLDVVMAPTFSWVGVVEELIGITIPGPEDIPRFHKWINAMSMRKSVIDTLPSKEEIIKVWSAVIKSKAAEQATTSAK